MLKKIVNFGIVGILATAIDFVLLFILTSGIKMDVYVAAGISFTVSLCFNFYASMKYVFVAKPEMTVMKQAVIFLITSLIGLLLNQLVMYVCIDTLGLYYLLAKGIATVLVMGFNFVARSMLLE